MTLRRAISFLLMGQMSSLLGQQNDRIVVEPGVAAVHVDLALAKNHQEVCTTIASSLVVGQGPMGLGIFTEVQCVDSITKARQNKNRYPWIISVTRAGEDEFVTKIFYQRISAQMPLVSLKTRRYRQLDESIKKKSFLDIFAVRAVLRLPVWGAARKKDLVREPEWRSPEFSTDMQDFASPTTDHFNVYALNYAVKARLWRSISLGKLKDWETERQQASDEWVWYGSGEELPNETNQKLEREYDALVYPPLKEVPREKYIARWKDHGLIGFRSGKQILMGDPLTDQLFLHEIFADTGPPLGLIANIQFMPKVELPETLKSMSVLTMSLGKSFSLGFPSYRIPRIQLTPQIGYHKLNLLLPVDETDLTKGSIDYSQEKVISWGGSASASVLLSQSLWAKPFYSYSLGGKSFSVREATARIWYLGADLFWLWKLAPPTFAIHGFYEYQSVKFMKVDTTLFDNSEVDIGLGFVGLGASYLW